VVEEAVSYVRIKLVGQRAEEIFAGDGEPAFECERNASVGGRVVGVGDSASDEITADVGDIRLPATVISFAANGGE
jgi:hypothetical protein